MEDRARHAVSRFVRAVVDRLGGQEEFRVWLSQWHPLKNRSAIGHWVTGASDPPAWVLFLVSGELDISLDDFAAGESEHTHGRRLEALEEQVARLLLEREDHDRR